MMEKLTISFLLVSLSVLLIAVELAQTQVIFISVALNSHCDLMVKGLPVGLQGKKEKNDLTILIS